jgi:transcription antitermination factor NusG
MNTTPVWYAVYTRPRWEKKVAELLTRKKIENYCPLNKVVRQWHDRKKVIEEPLFTSYVFVHITDVQQVDVRKTDGIINFVYWLGKPAVIRPSEIDVIRDFLEDYQNVQLEKTRVNPKDVVRIVRGPLIGQEGNVLEVYNQKAKVYLPSLGYCLVADLNKDNIEVISRVPEVSLK